MLQSSQFHKFDDQHCTSFCCIPYIGGGQKEKGCTGWYIDQTHGEEPWKYSLSGCYIQSGVKPLTIDDTCSNIGSNIRKCAPNCAGSAPHTATGGCWDTRKIRLSLRHTISALKYYILPFPKLNRLLKAIIHWYPCVLDIYCTIPRIVVVFNLIQCNAY
jgi:hypothetical protein